MRAVHPNTNSAPHCISSISPKPKRDEGTEIRAGRDAGPAAEMRRGTGNLYLRIGADERAMIRNISSDGKRVVRSWNWPRCGPQFPWPKGFKTVAELDQQGRGTPPVEFEREVGELKILIDRFTRNPRDFQWPSHPYFGRMSEMEWMRLGYLHSDHHLRQLGE